MMIGSYVMCFIGFGSSNATSEDTYCSDCVVSTSGISIINSVARSNTGACAGLLPSFFLLFDAFFLCF